MRFQRASVVGSIVAVLAMGMAYGQGYMETFEGYPADNYTSQWYLYSDNTGGTAYSAWVQGTALPTGQVAGGTVGNFTSTETDLFYFSTTGGDVDAQDIYFATSVPSLPGTMSAMVSIDAAAGVDVDGLYYYFVTDGGDWYYSDLFAPQDTIGTLCQYTTLSLTDVAAGAWTLDGVGDVAAGTNLYTTLLGQITELGVGVSFGSFAIPAGESFAVLNFDNIMVPEPSALVLACLGAVGLLGRRARRRQAA